MTQLSLSSLDDTVELQGTLERVVFHNEENGYTVFRVRPEGKDEVDLVTVVGHMGSPQAGASLRIKGRWVNNARFGRQVQMDSFESLLPATAEGIKLYLASGLIKGIGKSIAARIVKAFGEDTLRIFDEEPQRLLEISGITQKKLVTLGEYVSRMPEEQKYIYYASGDSVEAVDHLPQTELLKDRSMEILYFTDKTDEFIPDIFRTYGDKAFRSAVDGDLELGDEKQPETADHQETLDFLKETLGSRVDQVKASSKLKSHPVCLTSGEGMTFEMEKYFAAVQPDLALKAKRILEVNVEHPAFAALESARITDPDRAKKYAEILLNQAMLIAGLPLENPSDYTDLLCSLWK